jgi:hypothetical protein
VLEAARASGFCSRNRAKAIVARMKRSVPGDAIATISLLCGSSLALFLCGSRGPSLLAAPQAAATQPKSADYDVRQIEGWTVRVERSLLGEDKTGKQALELLRVKLYDIGRAVPPKPLAELRKVPIWISRENKAAPCSCYHPSPEWLTEHGFDPKKARAVEITDAMTFLKWTHEQPWMVMHELAHAYHHQVLGWENAAVRASFERAQASKRYESVLRYNGLQERHYCLNNDQEFFAEMSETWFGTNDFYPFVRPELQVSDPGTAELMKSIWGE